MKVKLLCRKQKLQVKVLISFEFNLSVFHTIICYCIMSQTREVNYSCVVLEGLHYFREIGCQKSHWWIGICYSYIQNPIGLLSGHNVCIVNHVHINFYENVTTFRSGLCYRKSVCVCSVCALYSGGWNFRQYFFIILYLCHTLTSVQNFTEIISGEPLDRGIKHKRGSNIERCHIRVSHLLMSFLWPSYIAN